MDGRVRFRGRLTEMIKIGGVNVAPLEVEQVLLQHPDIVQAYVVGVPDRSKGEIVAAAVELRSLSRRPVVLELCGVASALGQRPRAERHWYDQSAANRCSSTPTPKRKPS